MIERTISAIDKRLRDLEKASLGLRVGTVEATNPLAVSLGGGEPYAGVPALASADVAIGERIAALMAGGRLLVLGGIDPIPGAVGDGIADDTGPVHDWLRKHTQRQAVLPPGAYRYFETPPVPQGTSIFGNGVLSILKPDGCDGLDFAVSNNIAPIQCRNFRMEGSGSGVTAIKVMGDGDLGRTTGVTFQDVYINNFETGAHFRSLWDSRVLGCTFNNVWNGIKFAGQSVHCLVDAATTILKGSATGPGDSVGILVDQADDYTAGINPRRPEDIQVHRARIYGFDINIDHVRCLYAVYASNDLDQATLVGLRYGQTAGGLTVANNYIALTDSAALYGIYGNAAASGAVDAVSILGNTLRGNGTINVASVGILIDTNQHEAQVLGNSMLGFLNSDIYINAARRVKIRDNKCLSTGTSASIRARTMKHCAFEENYLQNGYDVAGGTNQQSTFGATYGSVSTLLEGNAVIPAGATSVAVTFAGLPGVPPDFDSAGGLSPHIDVLAPPANLGAVWVTGVSDAGFTINCGVAPGANATVRFIARSHLPGY
jgi:hypothetical protein